MGEGRLEHTITRRFWDQQAVRADDPRSTILDRNLSSAHHQLGCYQRWMFRAVADCGGRWRRVADLACGNGDWTAPIAERAESVLAVDFTPAFVAHCEQRLRTAGLAERTTFAVADLRTFDPPADLDVVVCGAVLQYIDDTDVPPILQRIRGALAPDGLLYMRTTVSRSDERVDNHSAEYQATYRTRAFYEQALASAGFTVVRAASTEQVVPVETSRSLFGRAYSSLGRLFEMPYRLGWRLRRMTMKTDVIAWVARPA